MEPASSDVTIVLLFNLMSSILIWMAVLIAMSLLTSLVAPIVLKTKETNYRVGFLGLTIFEMKHNEYGTVKVRVFCKKSEDEAKEILTWLKKKGYLTGEVKPTLEEYTQK